MLLHRKVWELTIKVSGYFVSEFPNRISDFNTWLIFGKTLNISMRKNNIFILCKDNEFYKKMDK